MRTALTPLFILLAAAAFVAGAGRASAGHSRAPGPRRGRRVVLATGFVAAAAGLTLVLAGVYTYIDSGPSRPVTHEVLALGYSTDPGGIYERLPLAFRPAPTPSPTPVPADVPPPLRDRPFRMIIDSVGVDAGVFTYGLDENRVPQVPLNAWDVAWYDFSARPGTGGNAVFAGHVTWSGRAVFYSLDQVQAGDTVRLVGEDGTELTYTVSDAFLIDPNDPVALAIMGPTPADAMTIITCGGTFFRTGDPVFGGDYTNRLVVRASLSGVSVPPAPAAAGVGGG